MVSSELGLWTNQEVAGALALPEESLSWMATGVSIDTRTLNPGDLYIAIHGETHDGHAFVAQAFEKGAVAAIVTGEPLSLSIAPRARASRCDRKWNPVASSFGSGWDRMSNHEGKMAPDQVLRSVSTRRPRPGDDSGGIPAFLPRRPAADSRQTSFG